MRQAVVLIHGIGEQKPMGTVRSFVKAILGAGTANRPTYWSKPDTMSRSFELRRLRSRGRPETDFYEYYWASNIEGTDLLDLSRWVLALVSRSWKNVPSGTRPLWILSRLLLTFALLILGFGGVQWWHERAAMPASVSLLASGILLIAQLVLVNYLGDAARYLSPLPRNIKLRQTIRKDCVELLRALQNSNKYDRVIVVGHSLGSVIAYDAITYLWQESNVQLPKLQDPVVQAEVRGRLKRHEAVQPAFRDGLLRCGRALKENEGLEQFRAAQVEAWREQRYFGNPWRITDLVTIGSPLAHAMLLVADSDEDFVARIGERELPTCPPQLDEKSYSYSSDTIAIGKGMKFTPHVLHHAAPFAVTRWTNLYMPATLGLFGDIVGGPLRQYFGLGVKDVPVTTSLWRGLVCFTPLAHTSYWLPVDGEAGADPSDRQPSLFMLRQVLGLRQLRSFAPAVGRRPKKNEPLAGEHSPSDDRSTAQASVATVPESGR